MAGGEDGGGSFLPDFILARYNRDGSLDLSFGVDGKVDTGIDGGSEGARAVVLQADGKIIAAGSSESFTLARYFGDVYTCDSLAATIIGTAGNDVILGTDGPDVIQGGVGKDLIGGRRGDDVICGGRGNDTLSGGKGDDTLKGGEGDDVLLGKKGMDVCDGGDHNNGDTAATSCEMTVNVSP